MAIEMERILTVDDDPQMLRIIELALKKHGYDVVAASSGQEALQIIKRTGVPHLALIDLHMPGMNGLELCEAIHNFCDMPIIMLSAISAESKMLEVLDGHAEDYIVKPFSLGILVARIRNLLNRIASFDYTLDPVVAVDEKLQVDFSGRMAVVCGQAVPLTPTESKLLYVLMRHAGRVVTTDFLLRRIWPLEDAFEDRLHVHIHRLRRKIEADHKLPQYVVSERGTGYTFPRIAVA